MPRARGGGGGGGGVRMAHHDFLIDSEMNFLEPKGASKKTKFDSCELSEEEESVSKSALRSGKMAGELLDIDDSVAKSAVKKVKFSGPVAKLSLDKEFASYAIQ